MLCLDGRLKAVHSRDDFCDFHNSFHSKILKSKDFIFIYQKEIYEENITTEVFNAAEKYFDYIFNLNEKYYSNLYILESALYKLKFKQIPFLYNMGALTTKVGYYYDLFSEIIEKTKKNPDLADNYCDINLSDYDSTFEQNGEHQINDSHIGNVDVHIMIATEYEKRIRQCLQN